MLTKVQNGSYLRKECEFPTKLNIHLLYDPAFRLLLIIKKSEEFMSTLKLHMEVYSNLTYNFQNLNAIKMFFDS